MVQFLVDALLYLLLLLLLGARNVRAYAKRVKMKTLNADRCKRGSHWLRKGADPNSPFRS